VLRINFTNLMRMNKSFKNSALSYLAVATLALTAPAQTIEWTASSTLASQGKNRYDAKNLQSVEASVAWCEGVKGQGIGERVNAKIIASDSTHIKSLVIVNGYAKDQTTWKNNSRAKTLRFYVGGKHLSDLHLSDTITRQIIQLPESISMKGGQGNKLDLSFEIAEVYPGSKFEDACITGISFEAYAGTDIIDLRDGKTYNTVKIGTQTWMAQNLNFKTDKSKCYDNKDSNCAKYGRLYNWEEANKTCPAGWHLPSDEERDALIAYAGRAAGTKLKAKSGWDTDGNYIAGTDEFGFSGLPGGESRSKNSFEDVGVYGHWWSSGECGSGCSGSMGNGFALRYNEDYTILTHDYITDLFSVRCIKTIAAEQPAAIAANIPKEIERGQITDPRDQQTYHTIKIGTQTWMAQNLSFKMDKSPCYSNKDSNCAKYGRLYNWEEANKACPAGWHLPSAEEWEELIAYVGKETAGMKLKSASDWGTGENYIAGTDEFGFSALPGGLGFRTHAHLGDNYFYGFGNFANWWSSSDKNDGKVYSPSMSYAKKYIVWNDIDKMYLLSVRCVQLI